MLRKMWKKIEKEKKMFAMSPEKKRRETDQVSRFGTVYTEIFQVCKPNVCNNRMKCVPYLQRYFRHANQMCATIE